MPLNLARLRRTLNRARAGRWIDPWSLAEREWTLCPARTARIAPAWHPPDALQRVRSLSPYRSWAVERPLIDGGTIELGPTVAGLFRDVDLVDGTLYLGPAAWTESDRPAPWWLAARADEPALARAQLVSTGSGNTFFGCLLLDDFVLELLSDEPALKISVPGRPSGHEADYRRLLGLGQRRTVQRTRVGELTCYKDARWNDSKTERYRRLRARLRESLPPGTTAGAPLLYIRRGLAGQRRVMANEPELEATLRARGFDVIDPMVMSVQEVARRSLDARLVVSIEGSQISHAIFSMADRGTLVVLQPPERFCLQYKEFADAMDMRFAFVVGLPAADGFNVDVDELTRLLDRLG